jgi:hypothetical protein
MLFHLFSTEQLGSQWRFFAGILFYCSGSAEVAGQLMPAVQEAMSADLQIQNSLRQSHDMVSGGGEEAA